MNHDEKMAHDEVFARWYREHHSRIRAQCTRMLRDPAMAEDMAQEALLRAWTRHDSMREEDLGAWLSVVARNLCISALRRDKRLVSTDAVPEALDNDADPAVAVGRLETRRNIRRAMGKLGERHRRVLYLRDVSEAEYEDIGQEFGLTSEGARSIAFRARRVLREHLAAVGEGFGAWIFGIRVRFFQKTERLRGAMGSVDGSGGAALQAGMNLALAAGLALATIGSVGGLREGDARGPSPGATSVASHSEAAPSMTGAALGATSGAAAGSFSTMPGGGSGGGLIAKTPVASVPPPATHDPGDDEDRIGRPIHVPIVDFTIPPIYWTHTPGTECYTCDTRDAVFEHAVCRVDPRACVD